ncbi:hypothetical protein [Variovorax sp. HJSM1_2]|uniref:hypothetical protein n=1 Tax=Variovorax sp. HJSM1_2 TaxID=3366263 RepID=UPI003BE22F59
MHRPHSAGHRAGDKTWWISNHDDLAIEHQHGRMADVIDMVNRTPGRSGASPDSELLVVHLMGTHPHYSLRFPKRAKPFTEGADAVETGLVNDGRSTWVRKFRQEYDAIVARLLQLTQDAVPHVQTQATQSYRA